MTEEKKKPKKEKKSIKEILELLSAIGEIGVIAKKVAADKRISLSDWQYLKDFKFDSVVKALEGIEEIPAEAKDVDSAEAAQLVVEVFATVKKIKEA